MPNPFRHISQSIHIDRGPYSMKMEDGVNAEVTMYGEVVERHPTNWWTGEKLEGDFIAQDDFAGFKQFGWGKKSHHPHEQRRRRCVGRNGNS